MLQLTLSDPIVLKRSSDEVICFIPIYAHGAVYRRGDNNYCVDYV
jgi:hypothetical protein